MDGFLQRPTAPANNPGRDIGRRQHLPDRLLHQPSSGRPPQDHRPTCRSSARWRSTTRCSTGTSARSPARRSRTASTSTRDAPTGTTTRDTISTLPTIWDQLSPDPEHAGRADRRVLLPRPAVPGVVGHEVPAVLAPVRGRRHRRGRAFRCRRRRSSTPCAAGQPAERELHRPGVRHRGQRHLRRRPPAGRRPAR